MKRTIFVLFLLASFTALAAEPITAEKWGEQVGFKPDEEALKIPADTRIDKNNADQYQKWLPPTLKMWIEKYGLVLETVPYKPIRPSRGFIEATNKYRGQAQIIDVGKEFRKRGIRNYTAGLPFPNPQNGLEIAWNYQYAYMGDDGDTYYTVYWISGSNGVEHTEYWRWAFIIRTINRTDLEPIPAIKQFLDQGLQYTSITYALEPYDKKGFGALYSRSVAPLDQQGHIYVPAMRRVLRNTFGTRGDTWNSTDLLYEDVRGYMGYPEWMEWKLIEKRTMFMPMHAGVKMGKKYTKEVYDLDNKPYWNPKQKYEPRPVYVVEVYPKFPDYPYSKQTMYFDAEMFYIPFKDTYDKKGKLWKAVLIGVNQSPDEEKLPPLYATCAVVDFQAEHATLFAFDISKANTNLDPKMFTLSNLRKRGR